MNKRDSAIFEHLMERYKFHWDANQYYRTEHDHCLEYYRGASSSSGFPLVYKESFNRILPIIYTILSRFMDQLFQSSDVVSVEPRKRADIQRAKMAEGVLNFQMESLNNIDEQGAAFITMQKWFFNALTFGKGIAKTYWRKEERIGPTRKNLQVPNFDSFGNFQGMDTVDHISQEMQTIYDGPYVEILHNKLFLPHPEYKSIQKMPQAFLVYEKSMDYCKRMADKGIYKNINELGVVGTGAASNQSKDSREGIVRSLELESAFQTEDSESDKAAPKVEIIEAYAKVILENAPYEIGSGFEVKGPEEEVIAHIGNGTTMLSLQKNTYGIRPLFDIGCYMHPELYWDLGLVTLTKGIQDRINDLANLKSHQAVMQINTMLKVRADADMDPESLVWKPFGIVPVEDMDDIEVLAAPDFNPGIHAEQQRFYDDTIDDITGMYPYNMGQTPQRQERVGVITSLQSMGEARAKLILMSMDYLGIRPLLKYMMTLNTYHLPTGFEYRIGDRDQQQYGNVFGQDLHADFDFSARYTAMEPALGKAHRAQQLVQMAGMWSQSPWINQGQYIKLMADLLDIREADSLVKTPQQFQQEQQQAAKAAMQAEQMKQQLEDAGKLKKGQQDIQGKMQVGAQKIGGDMLLEDKDHVNTMELETHKASLDTGAE